MNLNDALIKFEKIEKDLKLDECEINGVPWWDSLRYTLFKEILSELKLIEKNEKIDNGVAKNKFKKLINVVLTAAKLFGPHSPVWSKKNSIMIWGHPRRKSIKGVYVDIYTDPFINLLPRDKRITVLEKVEGEGHLNPVQTKNLFYVDRLLVWSEILTRVKLLFYKLDDSKEIIKMVEKRFKKEFKISLNIRKYILKEIVGWQSISQLMRYFFIIKRPSHFFIVVSAGHEAIIAAAKAANIVTIELQHGSPARGKLNYDYTSGVKKKNFPDYFLSFGKYWTDSITLPIKKDKIIEFGYPYLKQIANEYSEIEKENLLVIISQPVHTIKLIKFAIEFKQIHSQHIRVIFKPHPAEYYGNEPGYFEKLSKIGVEVAERNSDLYEILARAKWQVGVYSTALYEGLYFNVLLYVLPFAGYEHMKPILNLGLGKVLNDIRDFDTNWIKHKKLLNEIYSNPTREKIANFLNESLVKK